MDALQLEDKIHLSTFTTQKPTTGGLRSFVGTEQFKKLSVWLRKLPCVQLNTPTWLPLIQRISAPDESHLEKFWSEQGANIPRLPWKVHRCFLRQSQNIPHRLQTVWCWNFARTCWQVTSRIPSDGPERWCGNNPTEREITDRCVGIPACPTFPRCHSETRVFRFLLEETQTPSTSP